MNAQLDKWWHLFFFSLQWIFVWKNAAEWQKNYVVRYRQESLSLSAAKEEVHLTSSQIKYIIIQLVVLFLGTSV